jgi:hypothetical protein
MDAISHAICLIRRVDSVKASAKVQVSPIADFVGSQLAIHFRDLSRRELVQLYKHFAAIPSARGMTGNLFEAYYGQQLFRQHISIEYLPVDRLPDQKPSGKGRQALWNCQTQ